MTVDEHLTSHMARRHKRILVAVTMLLVYAALRLPTILATNTQPTTTGASLLPRTDDAARDADHLVVVAGHAVYKRGWSSIR